jgi:ABC-2 type transport system ATP-binding protein
VAATPDPLRGELSSSPSPRKATRPLRWATPQVLVFDEPVNGLDPDGVLWIGTLVKSLAAQPERGR